MTPAFWNIGEKLRGLVGRTRPIKIAIVIPTLARFDGMGGGARDTIEAAHSAPDFEVSIFCKLNEFPDISTFIVNNERDLERHPKFRSADIAIYHFGFYDDLFKVLNRRKRRTKDILFFHNITPVQFVSPALREGIERSFAQLPALRDADWYWPVSETNADVLRSAGFDANRIEVMPPMISWPRLSDLSSKPEDCVNLLFVGRITQSKGVLDLIAALSMLPTSHPWRARIAGHIADYDRAYGDAVKNAIRDSNAASRIEFLGRAEAHLLEEHYRNAHIFVIPSYHEGFCRPVIEGMRAGCIPVGYASYNLPAVAAGLGKLVAPGDIPGLSAALAQIIDSLKGGVAGAALALDCGVLTAQDFECKARAHVAQFTPERMSQKVSARIAALLSPAAPSP